MAQPSFGSEFGFGSGRYWLNNLMCDGTEGVLYDCPGGSSLGATTDCNGTENAAGIICRQGTCVEYFISMHMDHNYQMLYCL